MEKYVKADMEVIKFEAEDVITASELGEGGNDIIIDGDED